MSAIALVAGDAHPQLARDIAHSMEKALVPVTVSAFADGETRVRIEADVRDADFYIVQPTSAPTNERLMTLALIADAARAAGAARVTAVVPYFGYARQDVRKSPGEPRSAQLAARILLCAGVERMVALELHSPALESAFDMPLIHLQADELMLRAIRSWNIADLAVVAPDAGGLKRAPCSMPEPKRSMRFSFMPSWLRARSTGSAPRRCGASRPPTAYAVISIRALRSCRSRRSWRGRWCRSVPAQGPGDERRMFGDREHAARQLPRA